MPRRYIPRAGANRWTPFKKELLEQLRAEGLPWPEIAARIGHPASSCQTTLSFIRRERKRKAGEPPVRRAVAPVFRQQPTMPTPEPSAGARHVSTLIADAELRARIAILGPNGLLGDPLPGRSALDQKLKHGAGGHPAPFEPAPSTPRSPPDGAGSASSKGTVM